MADLFRITIEGAAESARAFDAAQRRLQDEIIHEFKRLADVADAAYRDFAPKDRGLTERSVHSAVYFGNASEPRITVRAGVRDPESGYAYVRVTRHGHRKAVIHAKHRTDAGKPGMLKVHYMGHRNPHIFAYRRSVRGAAPFTDWVEEAELWLDPRIDRSVERLGRAIETRLL